MNGFFPTNKKKSTPDQFDVQCAKILHQILLQRHLIHSRCRPSAWAKEFALLRTLDGVREIEIAAVLEWYEKTAGNDYIPEAFSGKAFRSKFLQLQRAMQKNPVVTVTDLARDLAKDLLRKHWPQGSGDKLPEAVQLTIDNYQKFRVKYTKLVYSPKMDARLMRLYTFVGMKLPSPVTFAEQWMTHVHKQIVDWDDWSGDILKQAFTVTNKRFNNMGRQWASEYCSDPGRWDKLMELLNED